MKTKSYEISLYRTTNGIFPTMFLPKGRKLNIITISKAYKTDNGAKRAILKKAREMGLVK